MCLWWAIDYSLHTETVQVGWIWGRKIQETHDFCDRVWLVYRPNYIVATIDSPPKKNVSSPIDEPTWGTLGYKKWRHLGVLLDAGAMALVRCENDRYATGPCEPCWWNGGGLRFLYWWVHLSQNFAYIYIYCFLMPQSKTCWGICRVSKPSRLNSFHHFSTFWVVKPLDKPIPLFGPL